MRQKKQWLRRQSRPPSSFNYPSPYQILTIRSSASRVRWSQRDSPAKMAARPARWYQRWPDGAPHQRLQRALHRRPGPTSPPLHYPSAPLLPLPEAAVAAGPESVPPFQRPSHGNGPGTARRARPVRADAPRLGGCWVPPRWVKVARRNHENNYVPSDNWT